MTQVLESSQSVGRVFPQDIPFIVFLDTYTDGWYLEYAVYKEDPTKMVWKRWHDQSLQEHGFLSWVLAYGAEHLRFRVNGGTTGATAFISSTRISFFR